MAKIKIGIIGASGFIGGHLIDRLKKNSDWEPVIFNGDLLNISDIEKFFNNNKGTDQLVNLVGTFSGDFGQLLSINTVSLHNLLSIAIKHGIQRVIYTSTGAVYGEPTNMQSKEEDLLHPSTLYGLSKMYSEECLKYYSRLHKFDFIVLRFPNVYGPGNNKGVVYNFLDSIKKENKVVIFGDGRQIRSFLHVSDAVEAIVSSLGYSHVGNQIFNIAGTDIYSLNDLVEIIKKIGLRFDVEYKSADASNSLQRLSEDISKAKKLLNWKPLVKLDDGLKKIITNHD
jgi:UDP-glucose 4-epimerase